MEGLTKGQDTDRPVWRAGLVGAVRGLCLQGACAQLQHCMWTIKGCHVCSACAGSACCAAQLVHGIAGRCHMLLCTYVRIHHDTPRVAGPLAEMFPPAHTLLLRLQQRLTTCWHPSRSSPSLLHGLLVSLSNLFGARKQGQACVWRCSEQRMPSRSCIHASPWPCLGIPLLDPRSICCLYCVVSSYGHCQTGSCGF